MRWLTLPLRLATRQSLAWGAVPQAAAFALTTAVALDQGLPVTVPALARPMAPPQALAQVWAGASGTPTPPPRRRADASPSTPESGPASAPAPAADAPASNPLDCAAAQANAVAQASRLLAAAPGLRALLLGEIHTSAADHAWQLATLMALAQQGRPLLLGLEMVPTDRQAALDRTSAGQLDDEAFLRQVGWAEVWGHDPELYLPLLRWARSRGVPLLEIGRAHV